MTTLTQATPGQLKQIHRVGADAIEKVLAEFGLDKDGAQRVHAHGDEFAEAIRTVALASLKDLSVSDKFKDEEVKSSYGYLSGYKPNPTLEENIQDLERELQILRICFPKLDKSDFNRQFVEEIRQGKVKFPKGAERWTLIPRWQKVAEVYNGGVQKVLDVIKKTRNGKFYYYREGQLGSDRLRQSAKSVSMFQKLEGEQKIYDILVVPAQFGIRHRGRSVRRVREVFLGNEFGLGAFAVGIMLLTHPERLMNDDDMSVDCSGDEFDLPVSAVRFAYEPYFYWFDGGVGFGTSWCGDARGYCGSASGFVPQN